MITLLEDNEGVLYYRGMTVQSIGKTKMYCVRCDGGLVMVSISARPRVQKLPSPAAEPVDWTEMELQKRKTDSFLKWLRSKGPGLPD